MTDKLMTGICAIAIIATIIFFSKDKNKINDSKYSNIASTIGVLGTFIGIFIALFKFDITNIEESVELLLLGMKTAFITSIFGMLASLGMKVYQIYLKSKNSEQEEDIDDIVDLFNRMIRESRATNETLVKNQEETKEMFINLGNTLTDNQKGLKEEILYLNNSLSSKQDELIENFKVFGEQMAENNSQALIDALNDVIKDFNSKITEQFGDNFKQLNYAVEALLDWQENYKEHVESATNQLKQTIESMTVVENSISNISEKSDILVKTSENLNDTLLGTKKMNESINESINVLICVSEKSKELIPNIDKCFNSMNTQVNNLTDNFNSSLNENMNKLDNHMQALTSDVSQAAARTFEEIQSNISENNDLFKEEVNSYIKDFRTIIEELNNCIPDVNEHLKQTNERFNNTLSAFTTDVQSCLNLTTNTIQAQSETLKNSTNNMNNQLDGIINDSTKRLEDITVNTSAEIKKMVEEMEQVFTQKVEQLDTLLENELNNALNSLGGQLITISERFANDYVPLANKLKEVVNISRGVV